MNDTQRAAMTAALEALEQFSGLTKAKGLADVADAASTALRAALADPVQETQQLDHCPAGPDHCPVCASEAQQLGGGLTDKELFQLQAAANYIDTLGGVSKGYRAAIAAHEQKRSKT
jgi:hypothetical protein